MACQHHAADEKQNPSPTGRTGLWNQADLGPESSLPFIYKQCEFKRSSFLGASGLFCKRSQRDLI